MALAAGSEAAVAAATLAPAAPKVVDAAQKAGQAAQRLPSIVQTAKGLSHVLERHVPGGSMSAGKSLFNAGEDISALVKAAEAVAPIAQKNGNLQRIVDAGRSVGTDRAIDAATSVYTVITNKAGELVTAFPGTPGG